MRPTWTLGLSLVVLGCGGAPPPAEAPVPPLTAELLPAEPPPPERPPPAEPEEPTPTATLLTGEATGGWPLFPVEVAPLEGGELLLGEMSIPGSNDFVCEARRLDSSGQPRGDAVDLCSPGHRSCASNQLIAAPGGALALTECGRYGQEARLTAFPLVGRRRSSSLPGKRFSSPRLLATGDRFALIAARQSSKGTALVVRRARAESPAAAVKALLRAPDEVLTSWPSERVAVRGFFAQGSRRLVQISGGALGEGLVVALREEVIGGEDRLRLLRLDSSGQAHEAVLEEPPGVRWSAGTLVVVGSRAFSLGHSGDRGELVLGSLDLEGERITPLSKIAEPRGELLGRQLVHNGETLAAGYCTKAPTICEVALLDETGEVLSRYRLADVEDREGRGPIAVKLAPEGDGFLILWGAWTATGAFERRTARVPIPR